LLRHENETAVKVNVGRMTHRMVIMLRTKPFPYALILRIGLDRDLGGIWAPITDGGDLQEKRRFEYIPFPHWRTKTTGRSRPEPELMKYGVSLKTYGDIAGINYPSRKLSDFLPEDEIRFYRESWSSPKDVVPHNDPNFPYATYGDYWRSIKGGRLPAVWKDFDPEDEDLWIFFVERLAPFVDKSNFQAIRRQQTLSNGVFVVGAMLVAEFVDISVIGWEPALNSHSRNKSPIVENFHFRRRKDEPVIVIGDANKTRLYSKALPLNFRTDGRTGVTEAGKLLGVTEKDQVRFKYIYDSGIVAKLLDKLN
jgi:hypothetical protein